MASSSKSTVPQKLLKFHPSKSFKFPKRKFGGTERSFRAEWCEKFDWLHYDVENDSAFCYLCKTAEMQNKLLARTLLSFLEVLSIGKKQLLPFRSINVVSVTKKPQRLLFICPSKSKVILERC